MNIYESAEEVSECFHRILNTHVNHIQKGLSLPPAAMPEELITEFLNNNPDSLGVNLRTSYQLSTVFDDLRNVDICPLATAEEVIAGHVPVIFPVVRQQTAVYYTPRSNAKHLQNIMDTHPDYFFVPIQ